tara:strand:+ start:3335 stop:4372 length:1038 start_codon:yes stop_codon:yes gene_type:complete
MTLALTYANLKTEVAHTLGIATDDAFLPRAIQRGLRQFYVPEPLPGERVSHQWTFLKTEETLTTHAATVTGTCSVSNSAVSSISVAQLTNDPLSVSHISITGSNGTVNKFTVSAISNITAGGGALTIDQDYEDSGGTGSSSLAITVHYNGTYALPTKFAGIEGVIVYDSFFGTDPQRSDMTIEVTDITKLRDKFQYLDDRDDKPLSAAVFATNAGAASSATGTQHRIQIYPIPDAAYRLRYVMVNEPDQLDNDSEIPLGGVLHAETILASCLSIAEQVIFPSSPHRYREHYLARLRASVELDRQAYTTENLGYNGDPSDHKFTDANFKRILRRPDVSVTVNGTQY